MEIGDLATWIGAIGTLATFVWSLKLHSRAQELHRDMMRRLDARPADGGQPAVGRG